MKDNVITQCQIIYQVLQGYLEDSELGDSVILWKNDYADLTDAAETKRAIDNFLWKISSNRKVALSVLKIKDELYKRLVTEFATDETVTISSPSQQEKPLKAQPTRDSENTPVQTEKANNKPSEKMLIFSTLLDSLTDEINSSTNDPRLVFKEAITELKLPNEKQLELFNFIDGQNKRLTQDYEKPDMTNILNQIYVTGCELLGPIVADDCLSRAVFRTEKLDASRRISPRSLL